MAIERCHHHYIGLDLGQRRDFAAVALLSVVNVVSEQRDPITYAFKQHDELRLRHLHRFALGTPYTDYPRHLRRLLAAIPEPAAKTLVVDGAGPGLPVVNMLRDAQRSLQILTAMILHNGPGSHRHQGVYSVGRRNMLSALRIAAEVKKLTAPPNLPFRQILTEELANVSIDNDFEQGHDDLVFAVALALFGARTRNPALLKPPENYEI